MTLKPLIAAAVAAAFAWPLAAGADDKTSTGASAGSDKSAAKPSSSDKASAGATKNDGGAEAMFKALDKNNDGFVSKEEAKGTPHDKDFAKLDKNGDGKLSREEHRARACRQGWSERRCNEQRRHEQQRRDPPSKPKVLDDQALQTGPASAGLFNHGHKIAADRHCRASRTFARGRSPNEPAGGQTAPSQPASALPPEPTASG